MSNEDFIQFKDCTQLFDEEDGSNWVTLYSNEKDSAKDSVIYSCFLRKEHTSESLKDPSWDFRIQEIKSSDNVQPILIRRHFYGLKQDYWEVTEDIRLFFNLFEDKKGGVFIFVDDNGDEEDIISITENEIKIKKSFLKEYLYQKRLVLAQLFDFIRYSSKTLDELGLKAGNETKSGSIFVYSYILKDYELPTEDRKTISMVFGKKIIKPSDSFKSLDSVDKEYEEFIIGVDENGREITFTCDERMLANNFGKNKENPHYLTPVFFNKEVLDKYYDNPDKYHVSDGYVSCGGLWLLRVDNSHKDKVMVFLGDLGQLTTKEQRYWRGHNIVDGKISNSYFKRSFLAEFCDPDTADLFFKQKFLVFQESWYKKHGWHLFLPLKEGDYHYFKTLRIPTKETQSEFDGSVLAIAKIIIDSFNVRKMKELLVSENSSEADKQKFDSELLLKKDDKSIEVFRKYLAQVHNLQSREMISFLKNLQKLRSCASAHRKGNDYEKIKKIFNLSDNYKEVFEKILIECITMLNTLSNKKYGLL